MTDEPDLDTLGRRHQRLQEQLDEVRSQLAPRIRVERERGETIQGLLRRSGYRSPEAIRQILDPERRKRFNQQRSRSRGEAGGGEG